MIACGSNLIFTQHTKCIGCEEYYKGMYILYGQGDSFFAHQKSRSDLTKEGFVVELVFRNDEVSILKHLVIIRNNKVVRNNKDYSFVEFEQCSIKNTDVDWVVDAYQKEKLDEIAHIYIRSCKAYSRYWKYYKRFFPDRYKEKLFASFSRKQMMQVMDTMHGTRRNEDMY